MTATASRCSATSSTAPPTTSSRTSACRPRPRSPCGSRSLGRPELEVPAAGRRVALRRAPRPSRSLLVAAAWSTGRGPLPAVGARPRRARGAIAGRPLASGCGTRPPLRPEAAAGADLLARAHAGRVAQHRAHQRRPLGRDPDASRARQRGPARGSRGRTASSPSSTSTPLAGVRGWPRTAASGCSSTPRPAEAFDGLPRAARPRPRWPSPVRGSSSPAAMASLQEWVLKEIGAALRPPDGRRDRRRASRWSSSCLAPMADQVQPMRASM